jgi:hypothetical protein
MKFALLALTTVLFASTNAMAAKYKCSFAEGSVEYRYNSKTQMLLMTAKAPGQEQTIAKEGVVLKSGQEGVMELYIPGEELPALRMMNNASGAIKGQASDLEGSCKKSIL